MTEDQEALAYHEAGHAIIAMKLGYRCRWVSIEPDPRASCEEPVEHALQILIASRIAEQKHTNATEIWRDGNDRVRACNLALWITEGDTDKANELLSQVIAQARARVEQHWNEIERLAADLLVKKRVTFP